MRIELTREQYTLLITSATTYLRLLANKSGDAKHEKDLESVLAVSRSIHDDVQTKYTLRVSEDTMVDFDMPDSPVEAAELVLELADEYTGNSLNYPSIKPAVEEDAA